MAYDKRSFMYGLIDAANKKREAENKLRSELVKMRLESQFRQQEQQAKIKQEMAMQLMKDQASNPQRYTPEQQYLRNRFREENPIAAMMVPEEGQQMTGIGYPSSEIVSEKGGTFRNKPIDQERQATMLLTKIDQMLAQGKRPHPAVLRLGKLAADYQARKGATKFEESKQYLGNLQKRLDYLTDNEPFEEKERPRWQMEKDYLNQRIRALIGSGPKAETDMFENETRVEGESENEEEYFTFGNEKIRKPPSYELRRGTLEDLIEEYKTTNDRERLKELESILSEKGVRFE